VGPPVKGFSYLDMALEIKSRLPRLEKIVALGAQGYDEVIPIEHLEQTPAQGPPTEPQPDDPFMMFFTSGTTASPKATVHTYNMRLTNSWFCARDMGIRSDDGMLCPSPLSHLWALLNYWSSVIQGCPQILLERYGPEEFRQTISRGETTVIMGARPTPWICWLRRYWTTRSLSGSGVLPFQGRPVPPIWCGGCVRLFPTANPLCSGV